MTTAILLILQRYWKPILGSIFVISLVVGIYLKGRSDAKKLEVARSAKAAYDAMVRYTDTVVENEKKKATINEDRRKNPLNDKRDSCLLSNDPFETTCVE